MPPWKKLAERLAPGLAAVGRAVLGEDRGERLDGLVRSVGPAARLGRADPGVLRAWMRNVSAIESALGRAEADAYTQLVVAVAEKEPAVARSVAYALPDHLARVAREERGRFMALLRAVIADDLVEALPLVIRTGPDLLRRMDDRALATYVARALELFRDSIQKAESFLKLESNEAQKQAAALLEGLALVDVQRTLSLYARAHCGEDVQVRSGEAGAFTDGRHLYLPERVSQGDARTNFLVYRVLTARNAGFLEFGTLALDLSAVPGEWPHPREGELEIERMLRGFSNTSLARDLFRVLEGARVERRVRAEYPGVARDMDALAEAWRPTRPSLDGLAPAEQAVEYLARAALGLARPTLPDAPAQAAAEAGLGAIDAVLAPGATVETTVAALRLAFDPIYGLLARAEPSGQPRPPQGGEGPSGPGERGDGSGPESPPPPGRDRDLDRDELEYRPAAADPMGGDLRTERMDGPDREVESKAEQLLAALRARDELADLAELRRQVRREVDGLTYEEMADFLERMPAPSGPMQETDDRVERPNLPVGDTTGQALEADAEPGVVRLLYPEWDLGIEDYKPRWVRLTEYRLQPGNLSFVEDVRRRHGALIGRIRRSFEALRPEEIRRLKGVPDGDEIDLDRVVENHVERKAGGSPTDRLYVRHIRDERDVAVAFLVDMSSSTNELANGFGQRIIDVEKEALVLIAEAVQAIGDQAAIYGFSGYGREAVAFYVAKDFGDPWDARVAERIGRISWKMENRDGAAIRHCTRKLAAQPSRVKLLILLSDGKPLDCGCDQYSDRYAQEDTRVALLEARQQGIHPFCITVDVRASDYMTRMYGEGGYTVIDRVETLPVRLPQIYRRLTR